MAQLFSNWTIKSSTEVIWWYSQEHSLSIIQKLYEDFQRGLMKNETAYEQTFNQLFFVELLGYTPNENVRPKAWTPVGGKIADVALWIFDDGVYTTDWVQVAVELKDCTVQLDKKQSRVDTSTPVEQWFQYKTSFKNCGWLIVSNYFVTRLYRDNKQDYEEWTLEQLLDPTNEYFQLRKLILLLHKNRLLKIGSSESFTEKLLSQFRIEQQNITKKFYKEYKTLRLELINDIRQHNADISIETAVEKAQKIIDRIVFIHFCEDRGLLPDGKLKENVYRAAEADFTPWEVLKKFFKWVDSGSDKLWIPHGYNGELFKPDTVLDWIHVWDSICKKFIEIGNYDFAEELSVTILWHIFEQSISDIENLKIELLGETTETDHLVEKKESKRKKDGIFYTPEYIVDYIVENSLMKYLSEKEDACLDKVGKRWWYKTEIEAYQAYQHILQNIKVVDPACGSGAFLVKVFDRLYAENERVGKIVGWLFDETETYKNILTNNIYGVDLNAESVEITKLSLWLKSAQKGKKLNNLDKNIKCGNSLIDDPAVAWDKAFSWEKEFAGVFKEWGFDVVVGNPPYVVVKKDEYSKYEWNNDLYLMFFEKTLKSLINKNSFYFGFITPRFFLVNQNSIKIRKYLLNEVNLIILVETSPFEDAETECVISIINSNTIENDINVLKDINWNICYYQQISKKEILASSDLLINTNTNTEIISILKNIEKKCFKLWDISISKRGMEIGKSHLRNNSWIPTLIGQDVNKYNIKFEDTHIDYSHKEYLRLKNFFEYNLIYLRRVSNCLVATFWMNYAYNKNLYWIYIVSEDFNPKFVTALLNSKLMTYYYEAKFTTKKWDLFPEIQTYLYEQLPIKKTNHFQQSKISELVDKITVNNVELNKSQNTFLTRIKSNLTEKITKKLENFEELSFKDFVAELKKQKVILSLVQQDEREPYFNDYKSRVLDLKSQIQQTDTEIDNMVFDLYGLTQEERKVVLDG